HVCTIISARRQKAGEHSPNQPGKRHPVLTPVSNIFSEAMRPRQFILSPTANQASMLKRALQLVGDRGVEHARGGQLGSGYPKSNCASKYDLESRGGAGAIRACRPTSPSHRPPWRGDVPLP